MNTTRVALLSAFLPLAAHGFAQVSGNAAPLAVKTGLWETTRTTERSPHTIPPDQLAKMTPEQQAEARRLMAQVDARSPQQQVVKQCLRPEQLARAFSVMDSLPNCKFTVVSGSSTHQQIHAECANGAMKWTGDFVREVIDAEHVRGSDKTEGTDGVHASNTSRTFTSRWLGPECGTVH